MLLVNNNIFFHRMAFNVDGALANYVKNKDKFACLKELLSNAIESCMIRKDAENSFSNFEVVIDTTNNKKDSRCETITVSDNGIGFNTHEWKEFCTIFTTNKRIYKCKGSGRIQFWHYFSKVKVNSIFNENNEFKKFECEIKDDERDVNENWHQDKSKNSTSQKNQTSITLENPKQYLSLSDEEIKIMIYNHFLPKLVYVKDIIKANLKIILNSVEILNTDDIPEPSFTEESVEIDRIKLQSGILSGNKDKFDIVCYRIPQAVEHAIWLCAKDIAVENIAKFLIHEKSLLKQATDNKDFILVFIKDAGDRDDGFLNRKITPNREKFKDFFDDFEAWKKKNESYANKLWDEDDIFRKGFIEKMDEILDRHQVFSFSKKTREQIREELKKDFNIDEKILNELRIHVQYGEEPINVIQRIHEKLSVKSAEEVGQIVDVKKEIEAINTDTTTEDWRAKIKEKADSLALLNHREHNLLAISELMSRLCKEELLKKAVKGELQGGLSESCIHNIFFKTKSNSRLTSEHDLWMFSEEYTLFEYVSSDQELKSIKDFETGEDFFDFTDQFYNEKVEELGLKEEYGHSKRPDIALFKDGSIVLLEFKAAFRTDKQGKHSILLGDHIDQLWKYADIFYSCMTTKSRAKYKKFYLYLIGKDYGHIANGKFLDNETLDGRMFDHISIRNLKDKKDVVQGYYELMLYEHLERSVKIRNDFFRDKLFPKNSIK